MSVLSSYGHLLFYAWLYDVEYEVPSTVSELGLQWSPIGETNAWNLPFCEYFGFAD